MGKMGIGQLTLEYCWRCWSHDGDVSTRNKYENIVKVEKGRELQSCGVRVIGGSLEGSVVWRDIGKGVKESIRVVVGVGVRGVKNTS